MGNNHQDFFSRNGFHFPKFNGGAKSCEIVDREFGFLCEEQFRKSLQIERKRTERSQKPILLVMLDMGNLMAGLPKKDSVKKISSFLSASTRDIDLKGWHAANRILGILYTEITDTGIQTILARVGENLVRVFGSENAAKVSVTHTSFPEDGASSEDAAQRIGDTRFYEIQEETRPEQGPSLFVKRGLDVVGSVLLIALFSPFFLVIPALIKLTSRGPVFFVQNRVGRGGRPFKFIKFRSMYSGNDSSIHREFVKNLVRGESGKLEGGGKGVYKIVNDPRVTPLGRILRKTSLDEIPQFFNVLRGEMSLVGPRPSIPYEIENYLTWHKRRVLEVKPGITGMWQVRGRSSTTFDTMVRMDLEYIEKRTLLVDLMLILQTPFALFKGGF
jgi:lipopolysaccharide/colanic/teichoic acid biosynthesis glycosyltransferase